MHEKFPTVKLGAKPLSMGVDCTGRKLSNKMSGMSCLGMFYRTVSLDNTEQKGGTHVSLSHTLVCPMLTSSTMSMVQDRILYFTC